ncbi:MAG TPA: FG-GAP repeat protein, partial [Phototrophicaceae bacterium]|nr:FG-GAP repeat protein [Phototrophicaceae bacterium]
GDGSIALVGAFENDIGENFRQGAAYIFSGNGSIWTQQARLTASDGAAGDWFGYAVDLNNSGTTALIGAYADDVGENHGQGSAYVFTGSGSTWSEVIQLTSPDGSVGDYFGESVALKDNGIVGLIGPDIEPIGVGEFRSAAYIFNWTLP